MKKRAPSTHKFSPPTTKRKLQRKNLQEEEEGGGDNIGGEESHGTARCLTGVSGATATRVVELVRLSGGGRLCKGRPMEACPAQPLWTTNGADPRGTARPGTSTGDTDYLWIVRQCRDSAGLLQNVSVVCKTELFAKTECPRAHKVSPQLAAWA